MAHTEARPRKQRDETFIQDLCDEVIGQRSLRNKRPFPFLVSDPGRNGRTQRLEVDIYYPDLNLVIEYREIQHTKPVKITNRRMTVSGVLRGEQRKIYDERRRTVFKDNNVHLVELNYSDFRHRSNGRLTRDRAADQRVIREKLRPLLGV
jgi:hypothetical protein